VRYYIGDPVIKAKENLPVDLRGQSPEMMDLLQISPKASLAAFAQGPAVSKIHADFLCSDLIIIYFIFMSRRSSKWMFEKMIYRSPQCNIPHTHFGEDLLESIRSHGLWLTCT
jgi:hypothetical protein